MISYTIRIIRVFAPLEKRQYSKKAISSGVHTKINLLTRNMLGILAYTGIWYQVCTRHTSLVPPTTKRRRDVTIFDRYSYDTYLEIPGTGTKQPPRPFQTFCRCYAPWSGEGRLPCARFPSPTPGRSISYERAHILVVIEWHGLWPTRPPFSTGTAVHMNVKNTHSSLVPYVVPGMIPGAWYELVFVAMVVKSLRF